MFLRKIFKQKPLITFLLIMIITLPAAAGDLGDLNNDANINSMDYLLMRQYLLNLIDTFPGDNDLKVGDLNGDNEINSTDLTFLRRYILRLIHEFPGDSGDSGGSGETTVYTEIAPYTHEGVTEHNACFMDSEHFRIYYGNREKAGPYGNLGRLSHEELQVNLEYLEAAYDLFINEYKYSSPGVSVQSHMEGPYKINIYTYEDLDAGGYMGYDYRTGLSYVIIHNNAFNRNMNFGTTLVHEFGHCITIAEKNWIDKSRTGAWWETYAQFIAEEFGCSRQFADLARKHNRPEKMSGFNPDITIGNSHLSIINIDNYYHNFMFFSYLTQNPDNINGLGSDAVKDMVAMHEGNETPIHTLDRMTGLTAQRIMANYNARLAYMDFENELPKKLLKERQSNRYFLNQAYSNLEAVYGNTYRVKENRRPMYGGSNIIPLNIEQPEITIELRNLANGLSESDFTAILVIKEDSTNIKYIKLDGGRDSIDVEGAEDVSLVITNTPKKLYLFDIFDAQDYDPPFIGLNYEVEFIGASPRY